MSDGRVRKMDRVTLQDFNFTVVQEDNHFTAVRTEEIRIYARHYDLQAFPFEFQGAYGIGESPEEALYELMDYLLECETMFQDAVKALPQSRAEVGAESRKEGGEDESE